MAQILWVDCLQGMSVPLADERDWIITAISCIGNPCIGAHSLTHSLKLAWLVLLLWFVVVRKDVPLAGCKSIVHVLRAPA